MKKLILGAVIVIATLISCSNDDDYHPNNSFDYKVTESVSYKHPTNDLNTWIEEPNLIFYATPSSRIFYDDELKGIIMTGIGRGHDFLFNVTLENGLYVTRDNLKEMSTLELKDGYIEFLIYYNNETVNKIIFTITPYK